MTPKPYFPAIEPPKTEEKSARVQDTRHGITRVDEFALAARRQLAGRVFRIPPLLDPAIRVHLEAENTYQTADDGRHSRAAAKACSRR